MNDASMISYYNNVISHHEGMISYYQRHLWRMREEVDRLEVAMRKIRERQEEYANFIMHERRRAEAARSVANIRIAAGYSDAMHELLSGVRYRNAMNAFESILMRLRSEKGHREQEASDLERQIQKWKSEIFQYQWLIRSATMAG